MIFQCNWCSVNGDLRSYSHSTAARSTTTFYLPVWWYVSAIDRHLPSEAIDFQRTGGTSCCHLITTCCGNYTPFFLSLERWTDSRWSKQIRSAEMKLFHKLRHSCHLPCLGVYDSSVILRFQCRILRNGVSNTVILCEIHPSNMRDAAYRNKSTGQSVTYGGKKMAWLLEEVRDSIVSRNATLLRRAFEVRRRVHALILEIIYSERQLLTAQASG